jgi:NAD(P)H-dependent FMN reductase
MTDTVRLAVIVGSTRQGRFADTVARWFLDQARGHGGFDLDVIDLADQDLPAIYPAGQNAAVEAFTARIEQADAFVVVTPEYNHGYPASLKQAIDLPYEQWHAKPVGFVSYGGVAGGARAVEQLRQVFAELHAVTVRDTVGLAMADQQFDADGQLADPTRANAAAKVLLDRLCWWAAALKQARATRPYAA